MSEMNNNLSDELLKQREAEIAAAAALDAWKLPISVVTPVSFSVDRVIEKLDRTLSNVWAVPAPSGLLTPMGRLFIKNREVRVDGLGPDSEPIDPDAVTPNAYYYKKLYDNIFNAGVECQADILAGGFTSSEASGSVNYFPLLMLPFVFGRLSVSGDKLKSKAEFIEKVRPVVERVFKQNLKELKEKPGADPTLFESESTDLITAIEGKFANMLVIDEDDPRNGTVTISSTFEGVDYPDKDELEGRLAAKVIRGASVMFISRVGMVPRTFKISMDNKKVKNAAFYTYQIIEANKESGVGLDPSRVVIGRQLSGKVLTKNFANGTSTADALTLIHAGSRSGKGLQSLNIVSQHLALGIPTFYFDNKPDISLLLWNTAQDLGGDISAFDVQQQKYMSGSTAELLPAELSFDEGTKLKLAIAILACKAIHFAEILVKSSNSKNTNAAHDIWNVVRGSDKKKPRRALVFIDEIEKSFISISAAYKFLGSHGLNAAKPPTQEKTTLSPFEYDYLLKVKKYFDAAGDIMGAFFTDTLMMSSVNLAFVYQKIVPGDWEGTFDISNTFLSSLKDPPGVERIAGAGSVGTALGHIPAESFGASGKLVSAPPPDDDPDPDPELGHRYFVLTRMKVSANAETKKGIRSSVFKPFLMWSELKDMKEVKDECFGELVPKMLADTGVNPTTAVNVGSKLFNDLLMFYGLPGDLTIDNLYYDLSFDKGFLSFIGLSTGEFYKNIGSGGGSSLQGTTNQAGVIFADNWTPSNNGGSGASESKPAETEEVPVYTNTPKGETESNTGENYEASSDGSDFENEERPATGVDFDDIVDDLPVKTPVDQSEDTQSRVASDNQQPPRRPQSQQPVYNPPPVRPQTPPYTHNVDTSVVDGGDGLNDGQRLDVNHRGHEERGMTNIENIPNIVAPKGFMAQYAERFFTDSSFETANITLEKQSKMILTLIKENLENASSMILAGDDLIIGKQRQYVDPLINAKGGQTLLHTLNLRDLMRYAQDLKQLSIDREWTDEFLDVYDLNHIAELFKRITTLKVIVSAGNVIKLRDAEDILKRERAAAKQRRDIKRQYDESLFRRTSSAWKMSTGGQKLACARMARWSADFTTSRETMVGKLLAGAATYSATAVFGVFDIGRHLFRTGKNLSRQRDVDDDE